jgi:hypothetical protein
MIFDQTLLVFASERLSLLGVLASRPHEAWALLQGATMKDDPRYSLGRCFEPFPFPGAWDSNPALEQVGREYYEFRAALMVQNDEGLTKTYNRFHDRDHDGTGVEGRDPVDVVRDIDRLRTLHDAMDRAVLDAYGWTDIRPTCEFILDYDDDEDEVPGKASKRRKPWRYRWPDTVRDEVLGRLLALNAERAREEALAGRAAPARPVPRKKGKRARPVADTPLLG